MSLMGLQFPKTLADSETMFQEAEECLTRNDADGLNRRTTILIQVPKDLKTEAITQRVREFLEILTQWKGNGPINNIKLLKKTTSIPITPPVVPFLKQSIGPARWGDGKLVRGAELLTSVSAIHANNTQLPAEKLEVYAKAVEEVDHDENDEQSEEQLQTPEHLLSSAQIYLSGKEPRKDQRILLMCMELLAVDSEDMKSMGITAGKVLKALLIAGWNHDDARRVLMMYCILKRIEGEKRDTVLDFIPDESGLEEIDADNDELAEAEKY